MMSQLFSQYPVLKTAYDLTQQLRSWYNRRNIGNDLDKLESELYHWIEKNFPSTYMYNTLYHSTQINHLRDALTPFDD